MTTPVPTPEEKALKRVLGLSRLNGWSVAIFAGLCLLVALVTGDLLGMAISLFVGTAGWMEIRGNRQLQRRDPGGMRWLVRSQMFLLAVILAYCARCLGSFDAAYVKEQVIPELRQNLLLVAGISLDDLLKQLELTVDDLVPLTHTAFLVLYGGVAGVSIIYQGGLSFFYRRKTKLVTEALTQPPVQARVPVLPPSI